MVFSSQHPPVAARSNAELRSDLDDQAVCGGVELATAAHDDGLDAQAAQRGLHRRQGGALEQPRVELARRTASRAAAVVGRTR